MPLPLETERLIIRSFVVDDAEAMYKLGSDPEVFKYFPQWLAKSVDDSRGWVKWMMSMERDFGYSFWAVVEKTTGEVIGDCGLAPLEGEGPEVELGCDLRRDRWNQHFATEAAIACLDYGFDELKLERIVAVTHPKNTPARKVVENLGFVLEGEGEHYGGHWLEYAVTKPGYREALKAKSREAGSR